MKRLFKPGRLVMTCGVQAVLTDLQWGQDKILPMLVSHLTGQWGEVPAGDRQTNDAAVRSGGRIISSYWMGAEKVWVITEADRSATTFLLPAEY